jgi:putative effector of murein hydrolase
LAGSLVSILFVLLLCKLFQADAMFSASMMPKSVTTAIALGISENAGGIPGLTAAAVVITGVEGAMLAPLFAKVFHITDPVAEGVAIGSCSHAIGTSKAMEIGSLQGAMSSIAICVCGIITSVLVMFF